VVNSANPATSIDAFWTFNRARLLTEFIPLPKPSIEMIVRGWYAGVLLGMVEGPTETSGPVVKTVDSFGRPMVAALPWPLLRHGKQPLLHRHRSEWLPALLEHVAMAMMLLSQDPHALDGYQALYDLGKVAEDHISEFILKGVTPAGTKAQVLGDTPEQRKADFVTAIGEGVATCEDAKTDARPKLVSPYDSFRTITFGYELMPTFHDQLVELRGIVESTELTQRRV
jgi:hypothetical protein